MAIKKFLISQAVTINNSPVYSSHVVTMDEADVANYLATLEGKYTVMAEDPTLSGGSDANVTVVNESRKITMSGKTANGEYLNAFINANKGTIKFKNTVDNDDLRAVLGQCKVFPLSPTDKPTSVSVNLTGKVIASE